LSLPHSHLPTHVPWSRAHCRLFIIDKATTVQTAICYTIYGPYWYSAVALQWPRTRWTRSWTVVCTFLYVILSSLPQLLCYYCHDLWVNKFFMSLASWPQTQRENKSRGHQSSHISSTRHKFNNTILRSINIARR